MTPCEKLGYKVGDRFTVIDGVMFEKNSIVELVEDDETHVPLFKLIHGRICCKAYGIDECEYDIINNMKKIEEV